MSIALPRVLRATHAPVWLALVLGLCGHAAQAQSLKALYEGARGYDAAYQSARQAADAAGYRAEQSKALNRPKLDAVATAGLSDTNLGDNVRAGQVAGGLEAAQSLYNPANAKTIAQAQRGVDVASARLVAAEQDLIVRVAQAYFDVLSASDTLNTVRQAKKAISEQLASAKRNFEVGNATITDTREAQARFDLITAQELAAENDLNVKRLALENVVGRAGLTPAPLAQPVALPGLQPASAEEWVSQADAQSPGLRQMQLALEVARLETEKARAAASPTLAWSASMMAGKLHARVPTPIGTVSSNDSGINTTLGLRLAMPLYSGGLIQNRVKETLSLEQQAQSDLDAARRSLAQGTRAAYFGVQSLQAQVKALEAAEASSRLALEATQLGYRVGVRVNLDVLNAQTQLFQAQRDVARARYDVIVNGLKLRQVAGVLQPQDVDAADALLAR